MTPVLKWIRCEVVDPDGFDGGQRGWRALADADGFEWQCGGWDADADGVAHVLARWRDAAAHDDFLAGVHDRLAGDQAATYSAIEVVIGPVERAGPWPIVEAGAGSVIDVTIDPPGPHTRAWSGHVAAGFDGIGVVTFALLPTGASPSSPSMPTRSIAIEPSWTVVADR